MVLLSQTNALEERGEMAELNTNLQNAAYQCGRLLAELEGLQQQALGFDISATIVDRFYGTASSAPASVFGRLLRGAQAHLGKLRTVNEGAYVAIQSRLEEILDNLDGFPTTLTLRDQGYFALGYYQQRAAHAKARRERRAAATMQTGQSNGPQA
jgi:CRISPR-associated protein Csd1